MAHDPDLEHRLRAVLADRDDVAERRMFGGHAFLVRGHLAVGASGRGGLMLRVEPAEGDALLDATPAEPFEMRGRPVAGWLRVASEHVEDDDELRAWVDRAVAFTTSLPPKR